MIVRLTDESATSALLSVRRRKTVNVWVSGSGEVELAGTGADVSCEPSLRSRPITRSGSAA
ncbi:hypothetical protein [Rhodococcus jostii]|uniref:hypothetical protein n=1 Tax=Rhodococcus jostii TaxID=132919 RepID=UPI003982B5E0